MRVQLDLLSKIYYNKLNMAIEIIRSAAEVLSDIDVFVPLGKQLGIGSSLRDIETPWPHLSIDSQITVAATGILCEQRPGTRLLLSGSRNAYFPQTARACLATLFPDIPPEIYRDPDEA